MIQYKIGEVIECTGIIVINCDYKVPKTKIYHYIDGDASNIKSFTPLLDDQYLVYDYNTIGGYLALNLMCIKTKTCYITACAIDWDRFKKVL